MKELHHRQEQRLRGFHALQQTVVSRLARHTAEQQTDNLLLMPRCVREPLLLKTDLQEALPTVQCCNSLMVCISDHTQLCPMWKRIGKQKKPFTRFFPMPIHLLISSSSILFCLQNVRKHIKYT